MSRRELLGGGAALLAAGVATQTVAAETSISLLRNRVSTLVRVGDAEPMPFLIDTGAVIGGVQRKLAARLGLKTAGSLMLGTVTGAGVAQVVVAPEMDLAWGRLPPQALVLRSDSDDPMVGWLPASVVTALDCELDLHEASLTAEVGDAAGYSDVPVEFAKSEATNVRRLFATVEIDGNPAKLMVDTGADVAVVLNPSFVRRFKLWDAATASIQQMARGAGEGAVAARTVRGKALRVGSVVLERPSIVLLDPAGLGDASHDGVIGVEALRRMRLQVISSARQLRVKPTSALNDAYRYNRSGVSLAFNPRSGCVVDGVTTGSPGAEAGLRVGDRLQGILNGDDYHVLLWRFAEPPGTKVELTVTRGGATQACVLTLRDLI